MAYLNGGLSLIFLVAISAFMAATPAVEAQVISNYIINITGNVRCATNSTLLANGTLTGNPFPNAIVQLQCGRRNTTTASNTTNVNGTFTIIRDPIGGRLTAAVTYVLTVLTCRVVVTTPLSRCNSNFTANGVLVSSLTPGGAATVGTTRVYSVGVEGFQLRN